MTRGVPAAVAGQTLVFDYGDLASLERLFAEHPGAIACVIMEPATNSMPCAKACEAVPTPARGCGACPHKRRNFLHEVRALTRREGALFILDEMITGVRWHLQGAQSYFDVEPDLSTFGKGMANGFALSALVGRREFMEVGGIRRHGAERVFLMSTTHGSEMPALGAFLATLKIYREDDVIDHLWRYGARLRDGINALSAAKGLGDHFRIEGPAPSLGYVAIGKDGASSLPLRTLFAQEMLRHGVMMPWIAVSLAHGETELAMTLEAAERALSIYAEALDRGVGQYLVGDAIKPVFRRYN
jgi:glutamate-1-semialdehyde 2,1-aminomutase